MYKVFSKQETIRKMNKLGQENRPFLFVISYNLEENLIIPLEALDPEIIRFDLNRSLISNPKKVELNPQKPNIEGYKKAFNMVKHNLAIGNTFLCNLTASVSVSPDYDLKTIYTNSTAKYKLWFKDKFVCFSPETFVKVNADGEISTFPMKGTLEASIPNAEEILKTDKKELLEHTTIVDLLRNDLSMVANKIRVERFLYTEKIKKENGYELIQMSSEIRGQLAKSWKENLGDWFFKLLPAGSICGAPKTKTLEIIKEAEKELHKDGKRGFYTGVFGVFDGQTLDTAVLIRFIEKTPNGYVFKSGGGITHLSQMDKEFDEIMQKVYVPLG